MRGFSGQNGSRLDEAYDCFRRVRDDYERATARGETETETRSRLVDRVLFDCLGWDRSARQELARDGDRLDYLLVDAQSGLNWVVVEAKRAELELVNPKGAGKDGSQAFKLGGPALKPAAYRAIRDQLLPYCAKWGSRIGVLTNGRQWIAALLPPRRGLALEDERAVIFGSLGSVQEEFERFYHFLSSEGVRAGYLEAFLSGGASPVLRCERSGAVVPRPAPLSPGGRGDEDERWFQPLERAIQRSFRPIEEDPRLLERCFVESRESRDAESRMLRLTELLAESLASADEQYGRSIDQLAEEPLWQKGGGVLALLSGQHSAGKTTFLRRFHDFTLPKERKKQLYWLHLQLDRSHEPLEDRSGLARLLARELQSAVFEKATSSLGRGAFFDLYRREWEQYRALYGDEKDEERRFIDEMRGWQQESPLDYAGRLLDYAVERHRRLPVLALDGLDALPPTVLLEALRVARLLFREHFGFFTVVLDDTTIWRLHREHREESRPFFEDLNFRAWLPRPKSGDVLKRRMA